MYYIKKNKKVVPTTDAGEVTKENFVCEPGGEGHVWVKLEKYEYDRQGNKITIVNQVSAITPDDFDKMAPNWKHDDITITMLHDPREGKQSSDVEAKLAILNAQMGNENDDENENVSENTKKGKK